MSLNIKLNDDYKITSDPMNFILEKRGVAGKKSKTPGKTTCKNVGFYQKLSHALEGFLKHEVLASDVDSLLELAFLLRTIQADIQVVREAFEVKA